jgi:glycosyltransferase involved in cell wall biosynthesis
VSEGREVFFRKMMETLREQTERDFEHIVVDGGSRDGSLEILEAYQKSGHIDVLLSKEDENLHVALNQGLQIAKGEIIHVMNTDNYFASNTFFERSLKAINQYGVDYTHADRFIVRRDGGPTTVKKGDERIAFFRMPFRWQTMLIKRNIYDELGPFDESYKIAADYKFMMQMVLSGKRGHYFNESFIYSLDGGITTDRKTCIEEVSRAIYEVYGQACGFSLEECREIYLKQFSPELLSKIYSNISNETIRASLEYGARCENHYSL